MRYQHVCIETFAAILPPHVVTSAEIEARLTPVYERLGLPAGRLELMSGIRERRFFEPGTRPGQVSARTAQLCLAHSGIDPRSIGAVVHGSVCRDQMEPATAAGVHHALGVPDDCFVLDVSNACLGLLNGALLIADLIETGRIRAGIVVGTEIGRPLVEGTIDSLLADSTLTRQSIKPAFASLTIGSGSAAILLCDRKLSRTHNRLLGGAVLADTSAHDLCAGGVESAVHGDDRPRMATDSEALLHAGVNLAERCWRKFLAQFAWNPEQVGKVFTHQVGRAHRKLLLERLGIPAEKDFPTVEFLGNTGATALPTAAAIGVARGHIASDDRVALLGIGSGLSSVMLGIEFANPAGAAVVEGEDQS
jgi:3-oxoacyl-[acyl-carrier-protein] synthase III